MPSPDRPLVIAHRTTMGHAPENTLLGVRRGLAMGVDGIEIDVQLCTDGVPVLLHDGTLDRTTNGHGPVSAASLAELRALDAGEGEAVPTLAEALAAVDGRAILVTELKVAPGGDPIPLARAVVATIDEADAWAWSWLWSFDPGALEALAELAPDERIAHLCLEPSAEILACVQRLGLAGVAMHESRVTARAEAAIRAHGRASFAWTANEPARLGELATVGLTGIVTDYPERLQELLREG